MKKDELIGLLFDIERNPEILIRKGSLGDDLSIIELEEDFEENKIILIIEE